MKPFFSPFLTLLPGALALGGCHLFANPVIDRTCEDLRACPGDRDTSDTVETAVTPQGLSVGFAVVTTDGAKVVLTAYDGLAQMVREVSVEGVDGASAGNAPVAFDPAESVFYFGDTSSNLVRVFTADGGSSDLALGARPNDIYAEAGKAWVATDTTLLSTGSDTTTVSSEPLTASKFQALDSVFQAYTGNLYLLDLSGPDSLPVLYRGSIADGILTPIYNDYDNSTSRSQDGFLGPEQMPYICSAAAGVYAVATLASGESKDNVAFPDSDALKALTGETVLSDVTDCGWDGENNVFVFFSQTWGVFTLEWGTEDRPGKDITQVLAPPGGMKGLRAAFYPLP